MLLSGIPAPSLADWMKITRPLLPFQRRRTLAIEQGDQAKRIVRVCRAEQLVATLTREAEIALLVEIRNTRRRHARRSKQLLSRIWLVVETGRKQRARVAAVRLRHRGVLQALTREKLWCARWLERRHRGEEWSVIIERELRDVLRLSRCPGCVLASAQFR